jgi:hypothetical protein
MSSIPSNQTTHWDELRNDLSERISLIRQAGHEKIQAAWLSIQASREALSEVSLGLHRVPNANLAEQIRFYKEILPFFRGRLIFFIRIYRFELGAPPGNQQTMQAYIQTEWQHIRDFHAENRFLSGYLRAGETWLDDKLFAFPESRLDSFPPHAELPPPDPLLHDATTTAAHLRALDWMQEYLSTAEEELSQPKDGAQRSLPRLVWTDSKAALIELAYALQSVGSLNDRKAGLREIIEGLQVAFHIDLGHYPRVFQEILSRKSGYSNYIDRLRDKLLLRIQTIEDKHDQK